jgi:hypothetical protein
MQKPARHRRLFEDTVGQVFSGSGMGGSSHKIPGGVKYKCRKKNAQNQQNQLFAPLDIFIFHGAKIINFNRKFD